MEKRSVEPGEIGYEFTFLSTKSLYRLENFKKGMDKGSGDLTYINSIPSLIAEIDLVTSIESGRYRFNQDSPVTTPIENDTTFLVINIVKLKGGAEGESTYYIIKDKQGNISLTYSWLVPW